MTSYDFHVRRVPCSLQPWQKCLASLPRDWECTSSVSWGITQDLNYETSKVKDCQSLSVQGSVTFLCTNLSQRSCFCFLPSDWWGVHFLLFTHCNAQHGHVIVTPLCDGLILHGREHTTCCKRWLQIPHHCTPGTPASRFKWLKWPMFSSVPNHYQLTVVYTQLMLLIVGHKPPASASTNKGKGRGKEAQGGNTLLDGEPAWNYQLFCDCKTWWSLSPLKCILYTSKTHAYTSINLI